MDASIKYTSFVVPDGQYEFLRVLFGLCNSLSVFQRFVNNVFKNLMRRKIVLIYMDNLIVLSKVESDGLENLEIVLRTASQAGLIGRNVVFYAEGSNFLDMQSRAGRYVHPSERSRPLSISQSCEMCDKCRLFWI